MSDRTEARKMNTFDVLFSGFAGSLLTVVVPLLARRYAVSEVQSKEPLEKLSPLVRRIVSLVGAIEISDAKYFSLAVHSARTVEHLDLTVAVGSTPREEGKEGPFDKYDRFISLRLPGEEEPTIYERPRIGWTKPVKHETGNYRLTFVKRADKYTFELRSID